MRQLCAPALIALAALFTLVAPIAPVAPTLAAGEPWAPGTEPNASAVQVRWQNYSGTGVCVAVVGDKSLVLTCNHIFAIQPYPMAPFPLADYPLEARVLVLADGRLLKATAVAGDLDADLALVVVEGKVPVARLADADAKAGDFIWHRGMGSGRSEGKALAPVVGVGPCSRFVAKCSAINGDSGAGVFDGKGRVVAIECGKQSWDANSPLRGTPVSAVRESLAAVGKKACRELAEAALNVAPNPSKE